LAGTNSVCISGEKKVSTSSPDLSELFLPELQIKVTKPDDEIVVEPFNLMNHEFENYVVDYVITMPKDREK